MGDWLDGLGTAAACFVVGPLVLPLVFMIKQPDPFVAIFTISVGAGLLSFGIYRLTKKLQKLGKEAMTEYS